MRHGFGITPRLFLLGLSVIFFLLIILFLTIPAKTNTQKGDVPSISEQSTNTSVATSSTSIISSPTYSKPTISLQTQVLPISSNSVCADIWEIKPPTTLPDWLSSPPNADGLYSEVKYFYLAGHFISEGIVDASECPSGGLTSDGVANSCGMDKAYAKVILWQNQFDQPIFSAAQLNQIPASIIKRLIAQETQFWPPNSIDTGAYGIGNVRSPGIEPLFMWNYDIYQNTCHDVYSQSCTQPYSKLPLEVQQILRGYFISHYINSYCDTCLNLIDLDKTKASIDYFAKLIVANCYQVNQILYNNGISSNSLSYVDAWRLTLANYTIGPTCINNGISQMDVSKGFSWEDFDERLGSNCNADIYINTITR
jgi:hypothetical protein